MAVSNFVSQLPIVFQLQIHPLFSPLRDSDSDFATYSPKSIHPSQRQQEALERRMKGERRNCLLFIFLYFFFPYSFLLSSQPCSKRESWLQSSASFVSPAIGPTTLHCRHQRPGGIHLLFRDLSTKAAHEPSHRNPGFCCYLFPHIRFYQLLSLTELSFPCLLSYLSRPCKISFLYKIPTV